jgi:hypothetical protein
MALAQKCADGIRVLQVIEEMLGEDTCRTPRREGYSGPQISAQVGVWGSIDIDPAHDMVGTAGQMDLEAARAPKLAPQPDLPRRIAGDEADPGDLPFPPGQPEDAKQIRMPCLEPISQ